MNPAVTAAPTSSARRTVARSESARADSSPRKYMRYVGSSTNPHGLTVGDHPPQERQPDVHGHSSAIRRRSSSASIGPLVAAIVPSASTKSVTG